MSDLADQIDALLALNGKGAVSHPVPGLAVELLTKAAGALRATPVPAPVPVPVTITDVRQRWFYVIVMPLNEDGMGPASVEEGEARKLTWEIWDQELTTHGPFDFLPDAIQACERMNAERDAK